MTFQLPTADSTIATNSYLPIIWTYNELVLDYIDLYLLPVNSFNSLVPLAVRQAVAAGCRLAVQLANCQTVAACFAVGLPKPLIANPEGSCH